MTLPSNFAPHLDNEKKRQDLYIKQNDARQIYRAAILHAIMELENNNISEALRVLNLGIERAK